MSARSRRTVRPVSAPSISVDKRLRLHCEFSSSDRPTHVTGENLRVPDHRVCADDELRSGVPLVVGDVVVGLKPNPLLPFGEEPVVAGLPFAVLHHCGDTGRQS